MRLSRLVLLIALLAAVPAVSRADAPVRATGFEVESPGPTLALLDALAAQARQAGGAVVRLLGNHEALSSDSPTQSGPYYEAYALPAHGEAGGVPSGTEAYYAFDDANVHYVVLDSSDSSRAPTGATLSPKCEPYLHRPFCDWTKRVTLGTVS